jgi:tight adherence protein C
MPAELLFPIVGVFIAVALAVGAIAALVLSWTAPGQRRLRAIAQGATSGLVLPHTPLADNTASSGFATIIPKSPKEMTKLRRRLARAGYHSPRAVALYSAAEILVPITFALFPLMFLPLRTAWIVCLFGGVVGYLLPGLILEYKTRQRQRMIQNGLPDALDLFIVCLEAGSSLDQAIVKASDELEIAYPALTEELRMVIIETRAGKPRLEAFKNFAARTQVDDVRALVAMLIQTDKFGTSVASALRTHAETARTKRRQRAEERAAKVGVKLVFPLVFCLFPALYVVILGPAAVQWVRVFTVHVSE